MRWCSHRQTKSLSSEYLRFFVRLFEFYPFPTPIPNLRLISFLLLAFYSFTALLPARCTKPNGGKRLPLGATPLAGINRHEFVYMYSILQYMYGILYMYMYIIRICKYIHIHNLCCCVMCKSPCYDDVLSGKLQHSALTLASRARQSEASGFALETQIIFKDCISHLGHLQSLHALFRPISYRYSEEAAR